MIRIKNYLIVKMVTLICILMRMTYRFQVVGSGNLTKAKNYQDKHNYIIASWHRNAFGGILSHAFSNIILLVSKSFDGDIVASVGRKLGYGAIRGSSSRGGKNALLSLIDAAQAGRSCAITVDGPRGPIYSIKPGIFKVSSQAQTPILPVAIIPTRYWILNSWDQMRIPKPFSKLYVLYGEPLVAGGGQIDEADLQSLTKLLKNSLFELEVNAYRMNLSPGFLEQEKDYIHSLTNQIDSDFRSYPIKAN